MKPHNPGRSEKSAAIVSDLKFSADLICWQQQHGRHALPWQQTRDAYRIWLSEIMLQQTQVATVIPYYQRFLTNFPNVFSLAAAPTGEVMALWSGLGYYTRARNLHLCAQRIVADYGGNFPSDPVLLAQLPGIGQSTAAAIAVFAFGAHAAILDGNVKRVFARVFGIEGYPGTKQVDELMWQHAVALLPVTNLESYTQGLMDLGATVCTRSKPACDACPMAQTCVALATQRVNELPVRKPKKLIPEKQVLMLIVVDQAQVLLEQRPDYGIWGGLLSLPEIEWSATETDDITLDRAKQAAAPFGEIAACEPLAPIAHGFTHFRLHIHPYLITLKQRTEYAAQHGFAWYPIDRLEQLGLPAPVRKILEKL